MNNVMLLFSGGKDSLATYLTYRENNTVNVTPITFVSDNNVVWNQNLNVIGSMYEDIVCIDVQNDVYYDPLKTYALQNNIDFSNYYFSSGEIDHLHEIFDFYPVVRNFNFKGFVNPYLGKPKTLVFDILKRYECEFVITKCILPPNVVASQQVLDNIGRRLTAAELEQMYIEYYPYFFNYQTFAVKCNNIITFSEEDITNLQNSLSDKQKYVINM